MVSRKITVTNEQGLHMRPASIFSRAMTSFSSEVSIFFHDKKYNAKSVMMLMSACIKRGAEIEIRCEGGDEEEAMNKAVSLIEGGLED